MTTTEKIPSTINETERVVKIDNAINVISYWEKVNDDAEIFLQFRDFNEIEISISDQYKGDMDDAEEFVRNTAFNAHLS